jgi:hypothetical protein
MIRVLRVLEYEYPDAEMMTKDMERWGVPANGVHKGWRGGTNRGVTIRSAVLLPHYLNVGKTVIPHDEDAERTKVEDDIERRTEAGL